MTDTIKIEEISADDFAQFGDILEAKGDADKIINQGLCGRYHDRAHLDFSDGKAGISIFQAEKRNLPLKLDMVERHPDGSQAFIPMSEHPFLVIVAKDDGGVPGRPRAFKTAPGQGVNYHRGIWHGVLTPLSDAGLFAVVDRIGTGPNLEEHWFETPFQVVDQ